MSLRPLLLPVFAALLSSFLLGTGAAQEATIRLGGSIPPEVDTIYERGLAYLASTQSEDGTWRSRSEHGITGLCLMAFLAGGEDPNYGRYSQQIKRALRSIIAGQEESGFIPNSMYHHGFAMLALAEAYGAVDEETLWTGANAEKRKSIAATLEAAVKLAVEAQSANRWGGWRYSPTSVDADTSVTGSVLMGLLACRNAGIAVPDDSIESALQYMQRNTASSSGFVAYSGGIGGGGESMARSAVATLVYAVGHKREWEEYGAALSHIVERLDHKETAHTHYFYYYMAQALFQGDPVAWDEWNRKTARMLSERQAEDGSFVGSYGEAYGTAMSLLSLALNYRFLPIYERF